MTTSPTGLMPTAFIGHGNPANALLDNDHTRAWKTLGATLPRPRAIVVVSAHWYTMQTLVTAMPRPRTIHDHWGFPPEFFDISYPAPGAPELALEVAELARPEMVLGDVDSWGLDHATWAVLGHMFPEADIPVVQLSVNMLRTNEEHFALGARLAPLREQGVLVVGSGNIVHDLPNADLRRPEHGADWAHTFDDAARHHLADNPEDVLELQSRPEYSRAVPTPDHFIPMLYVAGLAAAAGQSAEQIVGGYAYSTMSMASYQVGMA